MVAIAKPASRTCTSCRPCNPENGPPRLIEVISGLRYYSSEIGRYVSRDPHEGVDAAYSLNGHSVTPAMDAFVDLFLGKDGRWACRLFEKDGDDTEIWIDPKYRGSCLENVILAHEGQHEADAGDCCRKARKAYWADGADKKDVRVKWGFYMADIKAWTDCNASRAGIDVCQNAWIDNACTCRTTETADCCDLLKAAWDAQNKEVVERCKGAKKVDCPFK